MANYVFKMLEIYGILWWALGKYGMKNWTISTIFFSGLRIYSVVVLAKINYAFGIYGDQ